MGRGLTKKQRRDAAKPLYRSPDREKPVDAGFGLPDMSHLKRENAIPADPKALVIDPTRWKTKTIREAVAEADAKGQAERDAKFRASRQVMSEQKGGGDFESKHPRVPRGEGDKSGEFTNK